MADKTREVRDGLANEIAVIFLQVHQDYLLIFIPSWIPGTHI